ncbi:hypothetical protein [Comamonas endophytica]|uniref:DUF3618 domain-containing protein n=1 Tax=Comamonas endophytica TaxID=2949090 RepID=A0ABY6GB71_9BURK|nr:hypothetical protein [Acidovorax sp. 5MLIR]MCD2511843.1 hypothetical protein [Acidovorax sp. D4N7]UYG51565.1 hypothetical protein M9799_16170 [Acidovorax sp. 5MLIR]
MNTATNATVSATVDTAIADVSATDEQRAVLQRIAAQRERLAARRNARAQALALRSSHGPAMPHSGPLSERALAFARLHPMAAAVAAGAALMIGPRRLIRWAGIVLPLVAKFRR